MSAEKSLEEMQTEVVEVEVLLGWKGDDVPLNSLPESMMLLVTEASEAVEAYRNWGLKDATESEGSVLHHVRCKIYSMHRPSQRDRRPFTQGGKCTCSTQNHSLVPKPEGVGSEFADVLIRLLSSCDQYGIDLRAEYERKVAYNRTRQFRHGGKRL